MSQTLFILELLLKKIQTPKVNGNWSMPVILRYKKKENGRIYFIVIDEEVYKIGSSECKGGIKTTFAFYEGGLGGSPSIRTFGIHLLLQENLTLGKTIKIYALFIEPIKITLHGLFTSIEKITYPQIKELEDLCREDYKKIYGTYPKWNFQENVEEWPQHIKLAYKEQVNNRYYSGH